MNDESEVPKRVPLAEPRPLSVHERALVDWFADRLECMELRAQAETASVVATCSCGCPSVQLGVPKTTPAAELDANDPDVRHGVDASFRADATSPDGRPLEVVLHVVDGRIVELEIWAGTFGGDPRTELPDSSTMRR